VATVANPAGPANVADVARVASVPTVANTARVANVADVASAAGFSDLVDTAALTRGRSLAGSAGSLTMSEGREHEGLGVAAYGLLVVPNVALDAPRAWPYHQSAPFRELVQLPGQGAAAPMGGTASSVLASSPGSPGAASLLGLSLVLVAAWRSLWRQAAASRVRIALPSLAPPG
jgi:hypothetical protein